MKKWTMFSVSLAALLVIYSFAQAEDDLDTALNSGIARGSRRSHSHSKEAEAKAAVTKAARRSSKRSVSSNGKATPLSPLKLVSKK